MRRVGDGPEPWTSRDRLRVALGELPAPGDDLGEPAQLHEADRGLQVGHAEVVADLDVLFGRRHAR